jgi:hypothetical protein
MYRTVGWLSKVRDEETELRRRGYSRDRMPDCPQLVTVAFVAMINELRERLSIRRVVVVADRSVRRHPWV